MDNYVDKEGEILYKDKYYNTVVGIYKIWGKRIEKSNDGHALYKGECIYCGTVCNRLHIRMIKNTKECHHLYNSWKNSRIAHIFSGMISRCYNSESKDYKWYGGKGIRVCDEWLNNPSLFEKWALTNGYEDNLTIDRIDENGNYSPGNCEWVSNSDNSAYKSTTNYIAVNNQCYSGKAWAKILNIGPNCINRILKKYGEDLTVKFIKLRIENPSIELKHGESWLKAYGLI